MLEAFSEHCIYIVKPSASNTEITQACDAGRNLLSSKATLKTIKDEDVEKTALILRKAQRNEFLSLTYPVGRSCPSTAHTDDQYICLFVRFVFSFPVFLPAFLDRRDATSQSNLQQQNLVVCISIKCLDTYTAASGFSDFFYGGSMEDTLLGLSRRSCT